MPKVSCAPKDAVEVSLGIQEGVIEVTKAVTKVHQFPPNKQTGDQGEPFPCVQLTVVRCDSKGERTSDDEITEQFSIGKMDKFHPGKAESATDDDPEDMGTEVDTEGNCIFSADGSHLNKRCKWIVFADSLVGNGFKAEVLGNGYMPDLVGLKCEVATEAAERIPGQNYKKDPTKLVVKRILQFPYDKKKAVKTAPKPAAATTAKDASSTPAANSSAKGESPFAGLSGEPLAYALLAAVATELAGQDGIERKKIQTAVQTRMMRSKVPVGNHKAVLDLVKSDEWLSAATTENENSPIYNRVMVDFEAGTAAFAAAE